MKKKTMIFMLCILILGILVAPLLSQKETPFHGSDDVSIQVIDKIKKEKQEPWFTPIIERYFGGELSSEMETLFFCIQTGIGVGVMAYGFGYLAARKKFAKLKDRELGQPTASKSNQKEDGV